ncbi:hypothetical protein PMX40_06805 [Clostridium paraputrificum]|nr:hypothetical protein [Clostridium paraputrificum]
MCKVYAPCHGIVFINYLTNLIPSKSISFSSAVVIISPVDSSTLIALCPGICFLNSLANTPPLPSVPIIILVFNGLAGANLVLATISTSVSSLSSLL